jgi:LmbE family N-acetylglucosaminyl deacetylase
MDDEEEEILRRKRATDAAKALGLAMQSSPSMSTDGSTEEGMDVEEIRIQLRQMRRRLRTRDRGELPSESKKG